MNNLFTMGTTGILKVCFFIIFIFCKLISVAQEYSNVKKIYFQQFVHYTIHVKLDDTRHELSGDEVIEYVNHSSDALYEIYMHLWPNAYKNNETALGKQQLENGRLNFYYATDNDRGYIDGLDFKVDGINVSWSYNPENIDIGILKLNTPLLPGGKISISTPFHVKIPKGVYSRLGHIGQQYQISQWYPKPAVYDKFGWHAMPYLDQGEFYSEFGIFDVYISIPKNYVLGATGDMTEAFFNGDMQTNRIDSEKQWVNEKLQETKLFLKSEKPKPSIVKKIPAIKVQVGGDANKEDEEINALLFPPSDSVFKCLHFHQENVHDFAWFCDKRYFLLKGEVRLPHSGNIVSTWVMFTKENADLWKYGIRYVNDAVYYYSLWNGDYPYNHATAVDGALSAGGGMEYPNITVIGGVNDTSQLENVIMHEVGHNWFYGILGSNERDHGWMDEGLNSFNELRYLYTKYPGRKLLGKNSRESKLAKKFDLENLKQKAQYELFYLVNARRNLDQPIELTSATYSMLNYGGIVYSKTAIIFDYLKSYLGDSIFDHCMKTYYECWKFKHPYPDDLRMIMEDVSKKDLSWLFDGLIYTTGKVDYSLTKLKKITCTNAADNGPLSTDGCFNLTVKNMGDIASPFCITAFKRDSALKTIWMDGFSGQQSFMIPLPVCDKIKIDGIQSMSEINRKNNTMRTSGLFRKIEPIRFQQLMTLENPNRTQLYYYPIVGWNNYDKLMPGLALYSGLLPYNKFEYALIPMYGIGSKDLVGTGMAGYTFLPNSDIFQSLHFVISGKRYHYNRMANKFLWDRKYYKIAPGLTIDFRKKEMRSNVNNSFRYRFVFINEDRSQYFSTENGTLFGFTKARNQYWVNDISYILSNERNLNPFDITVNMQQSEGFSKISFTGNYRVTYRGKRGLDMRLFYGTFLSDDGFSTRFGFGISGNSDYLYDQIFLGRSESTGWMSQQVVVNDGAFKSFLGIPLTNKWLIAVNLISSTGKKFPLKIFADAGYSPEMKNPAFDGGVLFSLIPGKIEVFLPLYQATFPGIPEKIEYPQAIRFVFNIGTINPYEVARTIQL